MSRTSSSTIGLKYVVMSIASGNITKHGSLGLDCSGLVAKCYGQDKNLLMSTLKLASSGSGQQLDIFKQAEKAGMAYVHTNFNLLSAGDFIHHDGHVMIATGNVRKDADGNVVSYETIEANSTDVGSVKMWRNVADRKDNTIAHPFRTTDVTGPPSSFTDFNDSDSETTRSYTPEERTEKNKIQTTVDK